MKRSLSDEEQNISILKEQQASGPIQEPCIEHGIKDASIYMRKQKTAAWTFRSLNSLVCSKTPTPN